MHTTAIPGTHIYSAEKVWESVRRDHFVTMVPP